MLILPPVVLFSQSFSTSLPISDSPLKSVYLVGQKVHMGFPIRADWKIPNEVFGKPSIAVITQSMVVHIYGWLEDFHNDIDDLSLRKKKKSELNLWSRNLCVFLPILQHVIQATGLQDVVLLCTLTVHTIIPMLQGSASGLMQSCH